MSHHENKKPYAKSLHDEIDWKIVDQLHSAVSQISGFCFDIKKFCITTLFIVLAFISKFTHDSLDSSFFIASYPMIVGFWFLDSTAYYYQVKLRGNMSVRINAIEKRNNNNDLLIDCNGKSIIDKSRTDISTINKVFNAGFNHSMWLYLMLLILNSIVYLLYHLELIK